MGAEIAKCLPGPVSRKDGYITTGGGTVTWGYGHVLRQAEPGEYDDKYEKWRLEDLPIIPSEWKLLVADSCRKQFGVIQQLLARATEIVHAGDPDREGQLLIDEILDYVKSDKPVRRVLLNALDEKSIKKALDNLRDNQEFFNLKQSALARARADWLIGMNLSRLYTLAAQKAGHRVTLPVGRVKTPTLALVVRREREIDSFKPSDYFTVKAEFEHENGCFLAYWKPRDDQPGLDTENRLADQAIAAQLNERLEKSVAEPGLVKLCQTTEKKEPQRLPLSLSALQVLAGKKHGYDPQTVLDTAQRLYERKLTTYPRSDCEFLPENQHAEAPEILENLTGIAQAQISGWATAADSTIKSRAWNDKKITAHHAIIPTTVKCNFAAMGELDRNIYLLIAQAYLAQFYPVHVFNQTKVEIGYDSEIFTANGRIIVEAGWKALYGADTEESDDDDSSSTLPAMKKGDAAAFVRAAADKKATKPPQRFTAATLLAAMKEIHKYVKNPELKKQLKDVAGIGTEATRATIIKELIDRGFLSEEKKKKYLKPTEMAYLLIDALPDELTYPDSTAIWESILYEMSNGGSSLEDFLLQQTRFTTELCAKLSEVNIAVKGEHTCPQCGKGVLQQRKGRNGPFWGCSQYPQCKAGYDDHNGQPAKPDYLCPRCKRGALKLRNGQNGPFWGCASFPVCRATFPDDNGKPKLPMIREKA